MNKRILLHVGATALLLGIPSGSAWAESITCGSSNPHPVCAASYATHPSGALRTGQQHSGTAVLSGKTVKFVCFGGAQNSPRRCTY